MPRQFFPGTAELVVSVVDAVQVHGAATKEQISKFCDLSDDRAEQGLGLAADLRLIAFDDAIYSPIPPLAAFASSPGDRQKATMLRVVLESYEPFVRFRERLVSSDSADVAANQTRVFLDLDAHREEIKDTLLSLGTYTNALESQGGGRYSAGTVGVEVDITVLSNACADIAGAEQRVRQLIGSEANRVSREDVVLPLSRAILKANTNQHREAIGEAGNAVESFIAELAGRMHVALAGAAGINQKLDKFRTANNLPKKIVESAKYLGHVRNAADHGIDTDVGVQWDISNVTSQLYPIVACGFIRAALSIETAAGHII
jgi:hypothetical protein